MLADLLIGFSINLPTPISLLQVIARHHGFWNEVRLGGDGLSYPINTPSGEMKLTYVLDSSTGFSTQFFPWLATIKHIIIDCYDAVQY